MELPTSGQDHKRLEATKIAHREILESFNHGDSKAAEEPAAELPTWAAQSRSSMEKHRGKSRLLLELKDFNSPPDESDSSAPGPPAEPSVAAPNKTKVQGRSLSRLEKELAAFNEDAKPSEVSTAFLGDSGIHNTRRAKRALTLLAQNKLPSPIKNLNLARLTARTKVSQDINHMWDDDEIASEDGGVSTSDEYNDTDDTKSDVNYNSHENQGEESEIPQKLKLFKRSTHNTGKFPLPTFNSRIEWGEWKLKKNQVLDLLQRPRYCTMQTSMAFNGSSFTEQQPSYQPSIDLPDGYNFSMEAGVWVFSPTESVFRNFARFIELVGEVAGRERGVVKVVLPKGAVVGPTSAAMTFGDAPMLPVLKVALTQKKLRSETIVAYHTETSVETNVPASTRVIDEHRMMVVNAWGLGGNEMADAWRACYFENAYNEAEMIQQLCNEGEDSLCTVGIEADGNLRDHLHCGNPKLAELPGNRCLMPESRARGMSVPRCNISHKAGTPWGMNLREYAAYSLNYLHVGAPKCWTIVKPVDHAKLQELMHYMVSADQYMTSVGPRPQRPPQCDQSLGHQAFYLPQETLQLFDIEYSTVIQHQGELLITFPFAYRQGYNTGPNIAEEMPYATDRSGIFELKDLYHKCTSRCPSKPLRVDMDFVSAPRSTLPSGKRKNSEQAELNDPRKKRQSLDSSGGRLGFSDRKTNRDDGDGEWSGTEKKAPRTGRESLASERTTGPKSSARRVNAGAGPRSDRSSSRAPTRVDDVFNGGGNDML